MSDAPRVRVAAVIPDGERLVTVVHRKGGSRYHLLPGGGVEFGESLGEALVREVAEETGLTVRVLRPVFVSDSIAPDGSRHVVNVTFLSEIVAGEIVRPQRDPRVVAVERIEWRELGALDLRPPIGEALTALAAGGYVDDARYLGRLWVEEGAGS